MTARPDGSGPAPDTTAPPTAAAGATAVTSVLVRATAEAVAAVGGYGGGVYLRSRTEGLLLMALLSGLPGPLFRPWWRMHVNRPYPVAEAYRSGQSVHLADAEASMRRFPQLMAGLPYPFGSLYEPVTAGKQRFGVLLALRAATPGVPVSADDRQRLRAAADRLGRELAALADAGEPVVWEGEPVVVEPAHAAPRRRICGTGAGTGAAEAVDRFAQAVLSVDRQGRIRFGNAAASALLGPGDPPLRGRVVWEALPWLGHPAYEDHFRAVFLSTQPVYFSARRGEGPSGTWLSVGLYPGHTGVTLTIGAADKPAYAPASAAHPGAGLGSPPTGPRRSTGRWPWPSR